MFRLTTPAIHCRESLINKFIRMMRKNPYIHLRGFLKPPQLWYLFRRTSVTWRCLSRCILNPTAGTLPLYFWWEQLQVSDLQPRSVRCLCLGIFNLGINGDWWRALRWNIHPHKIFESMQLSSVAMLVPLGNEKWTQRLRKAHEHPRERG